MEAERTDEYESPGLAWLLREAKRLNDCLLQGGVTDEDQRRAINASFFFGLSTGLSEPVDCRGGRYFAEVAMRRDAEHLVLATDLFDFHEYAVSIVDEVYGAP